MNFEEGRKNIFFGGKSWEGHITNNDYYIVDNNIALHYGSDLVLSEKNFFVVEGGEKARTLERTKEILKKLEKKTTYSHIVAVGGNSVRDLASLVSCLWSRDVAWSFIPTTFISMGESLLKSKTYVNLGDSLDGRDLISANYPPDRVFIDFNFLKTLSYYDFYFSKGPLVSYSLSSNLEIFPNDPEKMIKEVLKIKEGVSSNVFEYGRVFGQSLNSVTNSLVSYGAAKVWGVRFTNYMARELGRMEKSVFLESEEILKPFSPHMARLRIPFKSFEESVLKYKKNKNIDNVRCVMMINPGFLVETNIKTDVMMSLLMSFLASYE